MSASEAIHRWALSSIETPSLQHRMTENRPQDVSELTRSMARGHEHAWVRFHEQFSPRIHRYLLVLLRGNQDAAGELLQITLTRIARHIRVFQEETILWHWIARIARTAAIDELRKAGHRHDLLDEMTRAQPIAGETEQYWSELILEALEQLEPSYRALLAGKYFQGLSVRQLAVSGNDSEKAVESRLVRARLKLREIVVGLLQREQ